MAFVERQVATVEKEMTESITDYTETDVVFFVSTEDILSFDKESHSTDSSGFWLLVIGYWLLVVVIGQDLQACFIVKQLV